MDSSLSENQVGKDWSWHYFVNAWQCSKALLLAIRQKPVTDLYMCLKS